MTPEQLQTLRNYIDADPVMSLKPMNGDGDYDIAQLFGQDAAPDFFVWQTAVPTQAIFDAITWAAFTPENTPDNTQTWANRSLACQGRQFNVQTMLVGRDYLDASKQKIRAGLQDALTAIPSGTGATTKGGGWAAVETAMQRKANVYEKLFATGTGTQASPATMVLEGECSPGDVNSARNLA